MLATARSRVLRGPFQQPQRPITIGIKRETYNRWERRAPLSPSHVEKLSIDHTVLVQPSSTRIFPDHAYQQAGAVVTDDLGPSDVILGVKRPVDPSTLLPNKTYLMFSHVIKGQVENMDLLQSALDGKVQLLDYECILQNGEQCLGRPKRLVAFGHYAGLAGATDALHGIGRRLWNQGVQTPLLQLAPTWQHDSLEQTRAHVRTVGDRIATEGLEQPLVISITGKGGSVHTGAMEMLRELPHEIVSVGDLPSLESLDVRHHQVYLCPVGLSDCYERIAGWASFDREDFAANPSEYRSVFAQRVAPYVDAIVNSVYWDSRYPRLLTKRQMRSLVEEGRDRYVDQWPLMKPVSLASLTYSTFTSTGLYLSLIYLVMYTARWSFLSGRLRLSSLSFNMILSRAVKLWTRSERRAFQSWASIFFPASFLVRAASTLAIKFWVSFVS